MKQRTDDDVKLISLAVARLKGVRRDLREAGAHTAATYLNRALKSVEGAERHARRMSNGLHKKRQHGLCIVCGHYGDDCRGTL